MTHRPTLVLALLLSLLGLGAVVAAYPPDPTWWVGIYDGGDYDDIVLAVTATDSLPDATPVVFDRPSPVVVGVIAHAGPARVVSDRLPLAPIRAPPAH